MEPSVQARQDELMGIVREAAGDDQKFMEGLTDLARRDVRETLERLHSMPVPDPGSSPEGWATIAEYGRKLGVAAAVVADYEREKTPA